MSQGEECSLDFTEDWIKDRPTPKICTCNIWATWTLLPTALVVVLPKSAALPAWEQPGLMAQTRTNKPPTQGQSKTIQHQTFTSSNLSSSMPVMLETACSDWINFLGMWLGVTDMKSSVININNWMLDQFFRGQLNPIHPDLKTSPLILFRLCFFLNCVFTNLDIKKKPSLCNKVPQKSWLLYSICLAYFGD